MTRINVGIDPKELSRQHLLAEHREIKRIPNTIRTGKAVIKDIPDQFCLGKGHVKFFYNKLGYLLERYKSIYRECVARNYQVSDYSQSWDGIANELMGSYTPTESDRQTILNRIALRNQTQ